MTTVLVKARLWKASRPNRFYYRKKIVNLKDAPFFSIVIRNEDTGNLLFAQLDARKVPEAFSNTGDIAIEDIVVTDGDSKRVANVKYRSGKIVIVDGYYPGAGASETVTASDLRSIMYTEGVDSTGKKRFTIALGENIVFDHDFPEVPGKIVTSVGTYAVTEVGEGGGVADVPRIVFAQHNQGKLEKFLILKAENDEIVEVPAKGFLGLSDEWLVPLVDLPISHGTSFKALKTFSTNDQPTNHVFPGIVSVSDSSISIAEDFDAELPAARTAVVACDDAMYFVGTNAGGVYVIDDNKQVRNIALQAVDGEVHGVHIVALGIVNGRHYLYIALLVHKNNEYYLRVGRVDIDSCSKAGCFEVFPYEIPVDAVSANDFVILGGYVYGDGRFATVFADNSGVYLAYGDDRANDGAEGQESEESSGEQGQEQGEDQGQTSDGWESSPSPYSVGFTDRCQITKPTDFDLIDFAIEVAGTDYATIKSAFRVTDNEYAVIFRTDKTYIVFVDAAEKRVIGDVIDISQFDGDYLIPFLFLLRESNGVRFISVKRRNDKAKIFSVFDDGTVTAEREIDLPALGDPSAKLAFAPPDVVLIAYFSREGEKRTLRLVAYHVGSDKLYDITVDENAPSADIKLATDNGFAYVVNGNKLFVVSVAVDALSPPKVTYTATMDRIPDEIVGFIYAENGFVARSGSAINVFVYDSLNARGSFTGWFDTRQLTFAHSLVGMAVPFGDHIGLLAQYANSDGKYITYLSIALDNGGRPVSVIASNVRGTGYVRYVSQELDSILVSDEKDNVAILCKLRTTDSLGSLPNGNSDEGGPRAGEQQEEGQGSEGGENQTGGSSPEEPGEVDGGQNADGTQQGNGQADSGQTQQASDESQGSLGGSSNVSPHGETLPSSGGTRIRVVAVSGKSFIALLALSLATVALAMSLSRKEK